jgi:hypothetical protein
VASVSVYNFSTAKRLAEGLAHPHFGWFLDRSHLGRPHAGRLGMRLNVIAEKEDTPEILVITSPLLVAT